MVTRSTVVRFLPFLLLHAWQSLLTYVLGRLLLTIAMAWAKQPAFGVEYVGLMPLFTAALLHIDRRRWGARDLYANLGFGARELLGIGAMVALVAELAVYALTVDVLPRR